MKLFRHSEGSSQMQRINCVRHWQDYTHRSNSDYAKMTLMKFVLPCADSMPPLHAPLILPISCCCWHAPNRVPIVHKHRKELTSITWCARSLRNGCHELLKDILTSDSRVRCTLPISKATRYCLKKCSAIFWITRFVTLQPRVRSRFALKPSPGKLCSASTTMGQAYQKQNANRYLKDSIGCLAPNRKVVALGLRSCAKSRKDIMLRSG